MAKTRDMTVGSPTKLIFGFFMPLLFGLLFQQMYNAVDTVVVGRFLGVNALAGVGATGALNFLILGFCTGTCTGFAIPVAQKFGEHHFAGLKRYAVNAIMISVAFSLVVGLLVSCLCRTFLVWMNTPADIIDDAFAYLFVIFLGIPVVMLYNVLFGIIRSMGDSRTPVLYLIVASLINVALDLLLIVVFHTGVEGAAIATVISQAISALLCVRYIRHSQVLIITKEDWKVDWQCCKVLLGMGLPTGLQYSITAIGSIMLQSANNALGTACVAAFTAAMRIKMFFMCPFESLGMAMATYSGQNYGAGKPERIWMGVKASTLMMIVYWAFTFCVLMFGARTFALLFVDASELEILKNTELFLHISVSFFPVLGLLCILRYTIQGVGYTNLAMLSGVSEMIARILVSLLAVPAFGYLAVCFGDPTAWIFADAFLIPAFIYVYRRILRMKKN